MIGTRVNTNSLSHSLSLSLTHTHTLQWWLTPGLLFPTWGVSLADWWLTPGLLFQTWGVSLDDWWLTPGLLFQTWGVSLADWCLTPGLLFQTWGVTLVPALSSAVLFSCKSVGLKLMVIVDVCLTTTYLLFHPEVAMQPCLLHVQSICSFTIYFVYSYLSWRMFKLL